MTTLETNIATASNTWISTRMLEQLALRTPITFHATSEQDLNPRSCAVNDHPSVLVHDMMVIEPGEKPTRMLTWKSTAGNLQGCTHYVAHNSVCRFDKLCFCF
jgi:hypothetical protein